LPRPAGETKYPLWKMVRLAVNGVIGFSDAPLRLAIWGGFAVSAFAVLYGMSVLIRWLAGAKGLVVGWASIIIVVSFLSGINMIMTGIMGLYVGRIHGEVKRRPLYVLSEKSGFDRAAGCHPPLEGERQRFTAGGVV
jgi:dolichol-phosphate mannosyltransferase